MISAPILDTHAGNTEANADNKGLASVGEGQEYPGELGARETTREC